MGSRKLPLRTPTTIRITFVLSNLKMKRQVLHECAHTQMSLVLGTSDPGPVSPSTHRILRLNEMQGVLPSIKQAPKLSATGAEMKHLQLVSQTGHQPRSSFRRLLGRTRMATHTHSLHLWEAGSLHRIFP